MGISRRVLRGIPLAFPGVVYTLSNNVRSRGGDFHRTFGRLLSDDTGKVGDLVDRRGSLIGCRVGKRSVAGLIGEIVQRRGRDEPNRSQRVDFVDVCWRKHECANAMPR